MVHTEQIRLIRKHPHCILIAMWSEAKAQLNTQKRLYTTTWCNDILIYSKMDKGL